TFLNHLHNIMGKDPEDTAKNFINIILKNMLQHISDNITFYQTILQLNRKSKLEEKIYSLIGENMQKYISTNHEIEGIPEKYFHSYVAG
ncbi:TetR/AcrR family transcriptional regulator C-terminal domain-containing protein, partial [Enterococcus faecalis]